MFKNILLTVDGSSYTDSVLHAGIELGRSFHSFLRVLSVADIRVYEWASAIGTDGFVPIAPSGLYQQESMRLLEEKCDKVLLKCSQILGDKNMDFELEKQVASPANMIIGRSHVADLVVMGKCGEFSRWDKQTLGASVQIVAKNMHKPLLVTGPEHHPIQHILTGYDGSTHANQALRLAAHVAEQLHARLSVISIFDDKSVGEHHLKEARDYLKKYNITMETSVLEGAPDKVIVQYANDNQVDLITIGAFGHSKIHEMLLGSNTEHILRHAKCHVLLAK